MNTTIPNCGNVRRRLASCAAISFLTSALFLSATAVASDGPVRIGKVGDVISEWRPDQHLYVKGNLGIGARQLASLEQWLDAHGEHWTIVLMRNANGETYVAPDGRAFRGMDAVEYALGHGLANRTPFGELEHPVSGETDGAIFVLWYEERKMNYYGSDAQDRRGLGESHWLNELDRPAFRAMRGGERIADAAKDTVSSISSRLNARIATEQADRKRQARERARAVAQTQLEIHSLLQTIEQISGSRDQLIATHANAKGELAQPPIDEWQNSLATIDDKLTPKNVRTVSQEVDALSDTLSAYQNGYAASISLDEKTASLEAVIQEQGPGPNRVAEPLYRQARETLKAADVARTQGDIALGEHLEKAGQYVANAATSIQNEEDRLERVAARNRAIRTTAIGTSSIAGLGLTGFLIFLNRRRAPAKAKAIKSFSERKSSVKEEMDNVLGLFTRSNEILGSKDKVERRGYVGETDRLSDSTFESVDDLLIMSNEVERVMGEAEEMLEPKNPINRVANVFSASNYEQAVNHISGKPLVFHRDRGLPSVFEEDLEAADSGDETPETITMTFEKVFSAFRQRCNDANATLDQLEGSLLTTNDALIVLQNELEAMSSTDRLLHESADADGYFLTPNLFEVLLPSAQADYDEADRIAGTDPVLASRKPIPSGRRKLANANQIIEAIHLARRKVFPELHQRRTNLEEKGYSIDWMEKSVLDLSEHANTLYSEAAKRDITNDAVTFYKQVDDLGRTAARCDVIADDITKHLLPATDVLENEITRGRDKVSLTLRVKQTDALAENNYVPDDRLAHAREQIQACRAAIHRGDSMDAEGAVAAARDSLADGHSIVNDSLAALDEFDDIIRKRRSRHATIEERIPKLRVRLEDAHKKYATSSMIFKAADPTFQDPDESVDHALENAGEQTVTAKRDIAEAESLFRRGRVLQAMSLLDEVELMAKQAIDDFENIETHMSALQDQLATNNREIELQLNRAEALHRELQDPRTTRPTMDRYEKVADEVDSVRRSLSSGVAKRDPFAEARPIAVLQERLAQLDAQLEGDKNAHAEATRAVRGAETQLLTARRLVEQASDDGIPDSQTTTQCVREIRDLDATLTIARKRLDVAHDQWQEVDADAARVHAALGVSTGRLQGELENAQRTVETFRQASNDVLQATRWAGPFGIRIGGSPGAQELERARARLNAGDYGSVLRLVRSATMAAQSAIQQAEREVARRRRDQARQAEAARRRRMRSSGVSFGGGRSSRPSPSFTSSRSSSTSGFGSRSGW